MGLSTTLYIGPYVIVDNKERFDTVTIRSCPSSTCTRDKQHSSWEAFKAAYCSQCGTEFGPTEVTMGFRRDSYEVLGETERLTAAHDSEEGDVLYLICNEGRAVPRDFHYEVGTHEDLGSVNAHAEVVWFENRYAKELELLRAAYGHVTVLWGVHYYQW